MAHTDECAATRVQPRKLVRLARHSRIRSLAKQKVAGFESKTRKQRGIGLSLINVALIITLLQDGLVLDRLLKKRNQQLPGAAFYRKSCLNISGFDGDQIKLRL